jgi:hypothetical protein
MKIKINFYLFKYLKKNVICIKYTAFNILFERNFSVDSYFRPKISFQKKVIQLGVVLFSVLTNTKKFFNDFNSIICHFVLFLKIQRIEREFFKN